MSQNEQVLQRIIVSVIANSGKQKTELYHVIAEKQRMIDALKRENAELVEELRRERSARDDCMDKIKGILSRAYRI